MAILPPPQHSTAAAIYSHYEKVAAAEPFRSHLGASLIGAECDRQSWLTFRWAEYPKWEGRILRLFDTGKREESRVLAELRAIGCEVSEGPSPGEQWRVSAVDGHFGGSKDAAVRGLPEAPKTWHVLEIKTHNAKSFKALAKDGVRKSKPQHYAQMQAYMHLTDMPRALYFAVNKDTDELHIERVEYNQAEAARLLDKAAWLIQLPSPPARIGEADDFRCKGCQFAGQCHGTDAPVPTCRSCAHSETREDGVWRCAWWGSPIPAEAQAKGCAEHRYIPAMIEGFAELELHDDLGNVTTWRNRLEPSRTWRQPEWSSWEMRNAESKALIGDTKIDDLKREFEGQPEVGTKGGWDSFPSDLPWLEDDAKAKPAPADLYGELYKETV